MEKGFRFKIIYERQSDMKVLVYDEFYGDMGCLYRNCYDDYHIIEIDFNSTNPNKQDELLKSIAEKWIEVSRFEADEVSITNGKILNCDGRSVTKWLILPPGDNERYCQEIVINHKNKI